MNKSIAYSQLEIKSISEERREIVGLATTATPDRVGDVVVPEGAKFKLPMPLLWQHRHDEPIGTIYDAKVTKSGIEIKARIAKVESPSQLSARLSEAWESIKNGLVRGLSIGFRPLEYSVIEETGGFKFQSWDWYETSAVTIPANVEGSITQIKSLDKAARDAASGNKKATESVRIKSSGVSEKPFKPSKEKIMSFSEKLKGFRDELALKNQKLVELAEKSAENGETFGEAEQEEFDNLTAEVKALEGHIARMEIAEKAAVSKAKSVVEKDVLSDTPAARSRVFAQVKQTPQLEKGVGFARLARCKGLARMNHTSAEEIARNLYGEDSEVYGVLKAAVAAGTVATSAWAGALVGSQSTLYADFAEFLRPMTIIGRMGQNGIPGFTSVPFRTRLLAQTSGGTGYWVGEGAPKPLTKFDFTTTTLEPLKVANIAVVTMELLRDSSPSADLLIRNGLAEALAARLDIDAFDPAKTASAGVSPASLTNGVTPIVSSGTDADAVRCDIAALLTNYANANNPPTTGVIVMSASLAIKLMAMRNALGQREFPEITMSGGILEGFPVLVSQYLTNFDDSDGSYVFMVNAADVYIGDEGGVSIDVSDQASVQMSDTPDNPASGSTVYVSLWQNNYAGFRAERTINWQKRRSTAVAVLSGVNWDGCAA